MRGLRRRLDAGRRGTGKQSTLPAGPGGDAEAAYATAELFAGGDLGALAGREGEVSTFAGRRPALWQDEAVVLIDRGTQGAAEVPRAREEGIRFVRVSDLVEHRAAQAR